MHIQFKRFYHEDAVYFVTSDTHEQCPYFEDIGACKILLENIRLAKVLFSFSLYAFIIMPSHLHILLFPGTGTKNISQILHFIKRHTSRQINDHIYKRPNTPSVGKVGQPFPHTRLVRHVECINSIEVNITPHFQWQSRFHDRIIRNDREFDSYMDYINLKNAHELAEKYGYPVGGDGVVDYPFYSYANLDLIDES